MNHCVDAGRSRDARRKSQGQISVENGDVRQDDRRRHPPLLVTTHSDDGHRRDFRAGSGRGRDKHQGKTWALCVADAPCLVDILAGSAKQGHDLRNVQRRPAAKPDDTGSGCDLRRLYSRLDGRQRGIRFHPVEDGCADPRLRQGRQGRLAKPSARRPGSVTKSTRSPSVVLTRPPICAEAPGRKTIWLVVLKTKGCIVISCVCSRVMLRAGSREA